MAIVNQNNQMMSQWISQQYIQNQNKENQKKKRQEKEKNKDPYTFNNYSENQTSNWSRSRYLMNDDQWELRDDSPKRVIVTWQPKKTEYTKSREMSNNLYLNSERYENNKPSQQLDVQTEGVLPKYRPTESVYQMEEDFVEEEESNNFTSKKTTTVKYCL